MHFWPGGPFCTMGHTLVAHSGIMLRGRSIVYVCTWPHHHRPPPPTLFVNLGRARVCVAFVFLWYMYFFADGRKSTCCWVQVMTTYMITFFLLNHFPIWDNLHPKKKKPTKLQIQAHVNVGCVKKSCMNVNYMLLLLLYSPT